MDCREKLHQLSLQQIALRLHYSNLLWKSCFTRQEMKMSWMMPYCRYLLALIALTGCQTVYTMICVHTTVVMRWLGMMMAMTSILMNRDDNIIPAVLHYNSTLSASAFFILSRDNLPSRVLIQIHSDKEICHGSPPDGPRLRATGGSFQNSLYASSSEEKISFRLYFGDCSCSTALNGAS
mmetsp:Transcript_24805/g.31753  ORF Transcript_24805/g.31753 Transcript_24805/m.31753 type:complete len:180 (+) Transcript_24805:191-730(+)